MGNFFNKIDSFLSSSEKDDKVENIFNFINNSKLSFYHLGKYKQSNLEDIRYIRAFKTINIPSDFSKLKNNNSVYEEANIEYGDIGLDVIISHEFGHQIQHQFVCKHESLGSWDIANNGDICLTKFEGFNPRITEAEVFFKADNSNTDGVERFMQQNFMESYADCYSGLVTYLKNNDSSVFDKIKNYRGDNRNKIKTNMTLSIEDNQILNGKFATTQYFNFYGVEKFKENFISNFQKEDIFKIVENNFQPLHHIIQIESLDGLYKTMKEEAKTNKLFLLGLKDFCFKRHNCSINDFFDKFEVHLSNLRELYCKYESNNKLGNNDDFIDFDFKSTQVSIKEMFKEYRDELSSDDRIKFDRAYIAELKLNCFNDAYAKKESKFNFDKNKIDLAEKSMINMNILNLRRKFLNLENQEKSITYNNP